MACASPELQAQETAYLAALAATNKWSQRGVDLELVDSTGAGSDTTVKLPPRVGRPTSGLREATGYDQGNGSVVAPVAG